MTLQALLQATKPGTTTVTVNDVEIVLRGMTAMERDEYSRTMVALQESDIADLIDEADTEGADMDAAITTESFARRSEALAQMAEMQSALNIARIHAVTSCLMSVNGSAVAWSDMDRQAFANEISASALATLWGVVETLSGMAPDALEDAEKN